jgi:hypothetical protein
MKKQFLAKFLIILLCASACVGPPPIPSNVLPREKMAAILVDVHLNQVYVNRMNFGTGDSSQVAYNQLEKEIFAKHKVDTAQYKRSFMFYASTPDYMIEIYDKVTKDLEAKTKVNTRPTQ